MEVVEEHLVHQLEVEVVETETLTQTLQTMRVMGEEMGTLTQTFQHLLKIMETTMVVSISVLLVEVPIT